MKAILWIIGIVVVLWYVTKKYTVPGGSASASGTVALGPQTQGVGSPSIETLSLPKVVQNPVNSAFTSAYRPPTIAASLARVSPNTYTIQSPTIATPYYSKPAVAA